MALLWMEGFDQYDLGISLIPSGKYFYRAGGYPIIVASPGVGAFSSQCMWCDDDDDVFAAFPAPATTHTIIFGCGYYQMYTVTTCSLLSFYGDDISTRWAYLEHFDGTLKWVVQGGATHIIANNLIVQSTWYYLEVKVTLSTGPANLELRIDGNTVFNDVLPSTVAAGVADPIVKTIRLADTDTRNMYLDDIYVCDDSGAINNDFLGKVSVVVLKPNNTGSFSDFTPVGAANNWDCVNNAGRNASETTYVTSTTPGHKDLYAFEDLPSQYTDVKAVSINGSAKAVGDGGQTLKYVIGSQSSSRNLPLVYDDTLQVIKETSDGTNAWTPAAVNSVEAGFEVE